ncbi:MULTISPECIES: alpha/beta hydrolase [unclassified Actinotalea]|uniref:alpha/beta hydrolase n=1 Tax=unclassified Actinotalea TaxID=2638618 RepID=UPI0015F550C2|nr:MULTISPECIES: alpha/beta hydrolase [unclassified Actinotalea]
MSTWVTDVLGADYQALTLPLADDDEGEVVATLVRYRPQAAADVRPARAVLYVHGWNDYFFQTGLAEFWHAEGAAFYALDLRKYGRSLRPHQTPNYVDDLATYDEELDAAIRQIHADLGRRARIMFMGHSTGGLVGSLWARRRPGLVTGLVLNSPWLELLGASLARNLSMPLILPIARQRPKTPLGVIDPGFYARSLLREQGGEWEYDTTWRPTPYHPVRAGWVQAVLSGHAQVQRGLNLTVPVFVGLSARSLVLPRWREEMREADTVLDVDLTARRAVMLGPVVTVVRVRGGLHDLTLSRLPARTLFYEELRRWTSAYGWM